MRGHRRLRRGDRRRSDYPEEFTSLPDYSARIGLPVEVVRELGPAEYDREPFGPRMYEITDGTGWIGQAWEDELRRPA